MSSLLDAAGKVGKAVKSVLFPAQQPTDGNAMPGDPNKMYNIFKTKNGRLAAANGSKRPVQQDIPKMGTPRLSNPEQDRKCPNCSATCKSLRCSSCQLLSRAPLMSTPIRPTYKPMGKRPTAAPASATATSAAPAIKDELTGLTGIALVDVDLSDDEDPIHVPATSKSDTVTEAPEEVKITPVPRADDKPVTLKGQNVFVGSMTATADVIILRSEILLKSLSVRNLSKPEKYNINIPIEDCHVSYYAGSDTSHVDQAVYVFIKMNRASASQLMSTLSIPVTDYADFRLDPKDVDEKYNYIAFKAGCTPLLKEYLVGFPSTSVKEIARSRAVGLFKQIRESNDAVLNYKSQLLARRLDQKDQFDRKKTDLLSSIIEKIPPIRSSGSSRKPVLPRNPEIIDLDSDDSAVCNGTLTPPPKRTRSVVSGCFLVAI